jgi:hypothetical protein
LLSLTGVTYFANSVDAAHRAMGYPGADPEMHSERFSSKSFPAYEFIQVPPQGLEQTYDVVIVGSGAGGGVMAAELSKAGKRVLVIEKGRHYHQNELTLVQADGLANLYESGTYKHYFLELRALFTLVEISLGNCSKCLLKVKVSILSGQDNIGSTTLWCRPIRKHVQKVLISFSTYPAA